MYGPIKLCSAARNTVQIVGAVLIFKRFEQSGAVEQLERFERQRLARRAVYGRIDSGKYFDGAQTLTVKFRLPRILSSRMIRT